jgi:hypothetical protein
MSNQSAFGSLARKALAFIIIAAVVVLAFKVLAAIVAGILHVLLAVGLLVLVVFAVLWALRTL